MSGAAPAGAGTGDLGGPIRLGHLGYLNSFPVAAGLDRVASRQEIELVLDTPAGINELLLAGKLAAGPLSLAAYLRNRQQFRMLTSPAIAAGEAARSVLLICRKGCASLADLAGKTISLTPHSITSRVLLRLLLEDAGVRDFTEIEGTLEGGAAEGAGAALIIGDRALAVAAGLEGETAAEAASFPVSIDLAAEWRRMTGLPMVFAVWVISSQFAEAEPDAARRLESLLAAAVKSVAGDNTELSRMAAGAPEGGGYSRDFLEEYFALLTYSLGPDELAGLDEFARRGAELGGWDMPGATTGTGARARARARAAAEHSAGARAGAAADNTTVDGAARPKPASTLDERRADAERTNEICEAVLDGKRLADADAQWLLGRGDLLALGRGADAARQKRFGAGARYATFLVDRNINYTNVCITRCKFCAFYRDRRDPDAYLQGFDELIEKVGEAVDAGATQVMFQGGHHPDVGLDWYEELFRRAKEAYPEVTLHSLGPSEILHIQRVSGLPVEEILTRLSAAGLDSLPGAGAEILVERVRQVIAPAKDRVGEWIGVMDAAHRLGIESTATMMMSHVETLAERVEHLRVIRDQQDSTGGFRAFIPWTYQPENTKLGGTRPGTYEYLRMLAVARLFLDNVQHIQGSWLTTGKDVGQLALAFGADDLGSIMLEENVVAAAGAHESTSQNEMVALIRAAGRTPAKRNTLYEIIETF